MSVKQSLFVPVFFHKCLMVFNDVEYTTFKMFVTQMSNYLFVISFHLMFYKPLRCNLARSIEITQSRKWVESNLSYSLYKLSRRSFEQSEVYASERTCQDNFTPRNSPLISPLSAQTGTDFAHTSRTAFLTYW